MPSGDKKPLKGICFFFFEPNIEVGPWAFQDFRFISDKKSSREDEHILKNGDYLKIYSPEDPEEVMWEGIISLRTFPPFSESVDNVWIRSEQVGISREMWATWFIKEYPAELVLAQEK